TPTWMIYKGTSKPVNGEVTFPAAPPWRDFTQPGRRRGMTYQATPEQVRLVNAALYLRRPLLVTGRPGVGKSSLAESVAEELKLGVVLRWTIRPRSWDRPLHSHEAPSKMSDSPLLEVET